MADLPKTYGFVADRALVRLLTMASTWIAILTAFVFVVFVAIWQFNSFGMDFGVYWHVANSGISTAYEQRATLNFPYPPTMLLWISPLSLIGLWSAYALWVGISIFALVASSYRYLDRTALLLTLVAPPVTYCLLTGQVSVALGALVLWACATDNRTGAGIALAAVASIKPQLVLMAPLLLAVNKDMRALIAAGLTFCGLGLLSVAAFGVDSWIGWLAMLDHFHKIVIRNGVLNVTITPASVARLWHLPPIPFLILGTTIGASLAVICRKASPLAQSAAIVAGSLLAAPYAVIYDLAALMPFLAWAVTRGRIFAVLAYMGGLNIVPLLATAFELLLAVREKPASE